MKKPPDIAQGDIRAEYDFTGGVRGKYVNQLKSSRVEESDNFNLDLKTAWIRAKRDLAQAGLVNYPYLVRWVELDLQRWLSDLQGQLKQGFCPRPAPIAEVPKPKWLVRPAAVLELRDLVIYSAIVGDFYSSIQRTIGPFQGDPDVAYQLSPDPDSADWVRSDFRIWRAWRKESLRKLREGVRYMVSADIAAFYENVDLPRLRSDLLEIRVNSGVLELLSKCLNRWAAPRGKGLPQSISASHILAKLYLHPVDQALRNEGFSHLRYVDDIRIFCRSSRDAKLGLLRLNELVRARGLNLQSAKTKILSVEEAKAEVDGVTPLLDEVQKEFREAIRTQFEGLGPYFTLAELDDSISASQETQIPDVLEQVFEERFVSRNTSFDKTLFHYLLNRLGKVKSRIAVPFCISQLKERPEETEPMLRYLSLVQCSESEEQSLTKYIVSQKAIYDYQIYLFLEWFWSRGCFPEALVAFCRRLAFDRNRPEWLRAWCLAVLGEAGNRADMDSLESYYANASGELERAQLVMAMRRTETSRRNAFYHRAADDGDLVRRATQLARQMVARNRP